MNVILIIIFCSLIMMKKYERVNLASDIYREKPTSRSPIALKKVQSSQMESNKKQYQNVCCPSCRYLFKIAKEPTQRPKTPLSKYNRNQAYQQSKNQNLISKQTQTQQYMLSVSVKTSPKKERVQSIQIKDNPNTDRVPQRAPHFDIKPTYEDKAIAMTDRKQPDRKQQSFNISPKKEVPNKQNQKISNLINKSKQKQQQFPARSAYLNSKIQKSQQKVQIKSAYKEQDVDTQKKSSPSEVTNQLKSQIAKELVNKIQLTQQINQIIQYHLNLPHEQLSVPSYCKMLIYDIQDRKQNQKQKAKTQQNKNYTQDQFYILRVNQLKSRYEKGKVERVKY